MNSFKLRANIILMLIVTIIPIIMVIVPLRLGGVDLLMHVAMGYFMGCIIQSLIFVIDWKYMIEHIMKKEE
jgi:F0F1-type ATP synthase membrane subunit a